MSISVSGELCFNLVNMWETVSNKDVRSFTRPQEPGQARLNLFIDETNTLPKQSHINRRQHINDPDTYRHKQRQIRMHFSKYLCIIGEFYKSRQQYQSY